LGLRFGFTCVDIERKLLWFDRHVVHFLTTGQNSYISDAAFIQKVVIPAFDWLLIRLIVPKRSSEPPLNCSHIFWSMKPKTTLRFLLSRCHFLVRTMTALQWPRSELPHITGKFEVFLTCTVLFHCSDCSGWLNNVKCNHSIHLETPWRWYWLSGHAESTGVFVFHRKMNART
jgi:hypothetical protein